MVPVQGTNTGLRGVEGTTVRAAGRNLSREEYLSQDFEVWHRMCEEVGCGKAARYNCVKCHYHQFLDIGGRDAIASLKSLRWFPPYDAHVLDSTAA